MSIAYSRGGHRGQFRRPRDSHREYLSTQTMLRGNSETAGMRLTLMKVFLVAKEMSSEKNKYSMVIILEDSLLPAHKRWRLHKSNDLQETWLPSHAPWPLDDAVARERARSPPDIGWSDYDNGDGQT